MVITDLEKKLGKGRVDKQKSLSQFTTIKIGGPAEFFFSAQTKEEVFSAVQAALESKLQYNILGSGSNVIISDKGLSGLVIRNQAKQIKIARKLGQIKKGNLMVSQVLIEVDSGVLLNQLVRFTCDEGLAGLERHLGLPGTVGGALYMNSKWTKPVSYVGDALYQAKIINKSGEIELVDRSYFKFGYDQSVLQKTHEAVISAYFLLTSTDSKKLWEVANSSMVYRRSSQPIGIPSAGCTFRNFSLGDAMRLGTPNQTTSAGYLLDQVGLKNFQIGRAKFSDIHANFILNLGGATATDVYKLIQEAKRRVDDRFGIEIEPEIVLLGEFNHGKICY